MQKFFVDSRRLPRLDEGDHEAMIGKQEVINWLAHRAGTVRLETSPFLYNTEALELNMPAGEFIRVFGKKEIRGFAGFVDLVGFSERVKGQKAQEIGEYLKPFLVGIVEISLECNALVDKTIGDEVMFILPDMSEDSGLPAVFLMGQLLGGIHDLQRRLGTEYPFRIGLSYGSLYIDQIKGEGYSEWTTVGESVHLAKRVHGLKGLSTASGIGGAFGILVRETDACSQFETILGSIAGFASRMTHKVVEKPVSFKGVSPARCALLLPKSE